MRLTAQIECINTSILLLSGFLMVSFTALFEYSTLIFLLRKEVFLAKKTCYSETRRFVKPFPNSAWVPHATARPGGGRWGVVCSRRTRHE